MLRLTSARWTRTTRRWFAAHVRWRTGANPPRAKRVGGTTQAPSNTDELREIIPRILASFRLRPASGAPERPRLHGTALILAHGIYGITLGMVAALLLRRQPGQPTQYGSQ